MPFAYADFHTDLLKGKTLVIACPKLDDTAPYAQKLKAIFENNSIKSVTVAHMEVPCCFGLVRLVDEAIRVAGKGIPFHRAEIGIRGERK